MCLTANEETAGSDKTPGRAATGTVLIIVSLYLAIAVGVVMFAGMGDTGNGLANPELEENYNIFAALGSPVLGPLAILLTLSVLTSSASSLQSTFVAPARTLLAMGFYRALPKRFADISPRFYAPGFATIVCGVTSFAFYAGMRVISDNVLSDTIAALGLMICFYYGVTAFACVWYFRKTLTSSVRHFVLRGLAPAIGGLALAAVLAQTIKDSWDPEFGSGSDIFGVGTVFVIGVGVLIAGAVIMVIYSRINPAFFRGETGLERDGSGGILATAPAEPVLDPLTKRDDER